MSDASATLIQAWHEESYQSARAQEGRSQTYDHFGLSLEVPPGVMPVTPLSELLSRAVTSEVQVADRVLDMGSGNGINGILAASKARKVVSVDINPKAVETTRRNIDRNGVSERMEAHVSDVFRDVAGRFDLIIFNPPARWFPPRDLMEMASTDENYRALTEFFENARHYLNPAGCMLIMFGSTGDLEYFKALTSKEDFSIDIVAHRSMFKGQVKVRYYVFKVLAR